jgi:hypothetical protein
MKSEKKKTIRDTGTNYIKTLNEKKKEEKKRG